MKESTNRCCQFCIYFQRGEHAPRKKGTCRYHTPTMDGFPSVDAYDDWCGKWESKEALEVLSLTVKEIQKEVASRIIKNNWTQDLPERREHLESEYKELLEELNKTVLNPETVAKEMFDVVWNLCAISNILGIELTPLFLTKIKELDNRSPERNKRTLSQRMNENHE